MGKSVDTRYVLSGPKDGFVVPYQNLGERMVAKLKGYKKRVLQVFPDESHSSTAEWILQRATIESAQLQSMVEPGNVAIVFCHNSPHYTPVIVALLCLGIICVPVNYATPTEELFPILGNLNPSVMLCLEQYAEPLRKIYSDCPILVVGKDWETDAKEPRSVPMQDFGEQPAFYLFTSGTSSIPKKITLTHGVFIVMLNSFRRQDSDFTENDVMVTAAPQHWYPGFLIQMLTLDMGCKIVVPASFHVNVFCHLAALYSATVMFLMPTQAFAMSKSTDLQAAMLSSVKVIAIGGSACNARAQKFVESRLRVPTVQWYGTTEIQVATTSYLRQEKPPMGSVGKLRSWVNMMVVNSHGIPQKANCEGELCFSGPLLSTDVTTEWFNTGDFGYYDDKGFIYVLGRKNEIVMYRGVRVYPCELELLLLEHTEVLEAAVTGVARTGEDLYPTALVVLRHQISPKDLQLYIEANVRDKSWHLRGGIYVVRHVPKTANGKIKRQDLRAVCQEQIRLAMQMSRESGRHPSRTLK